jgi:hypothetical protein
MDVSALRDLAIKAGTDPETLTKRPLTHAEYSGMNEAEKQWHLSANSRAVNAAFAANENEMHQSRSLTEAAVAKLYRNESETPDVDRDNTIHNFKVFMASYPQYINLPIHATEILVWLKDRSLYPEVENIVAAFKALGREGKLKIDGSQTGLVDETELTGRELEFHPQVNRLLQSVTLEIAEQRRVMRMPDNEFREWERKQKGSQPIPYVIEQRIKQAFVTLADRHPDFRFNESNKTKLLDYLNKFGTTIDAKNVEAAFIALRDAGELDLNESVVVGGEHLTYTDYSQIDRRQLTPKQESLAAAVNRMTLQEFEDKLASSPATRRAIDNLPQ